MVIVKSEKGKGVVLELNCSEINELNNALFHFLEYAEDEVKSERTTNISLTRDIYTLKSEISLARDLSHYGRLDDSSREQFNKSYQAGKAREVVDKAHNSHKGTETKGGTLTDD